MRAKCDESACDESACSRRARARLTGALVSRARSHRVRMRALVARVLPPRARASVDKRARAQRARIAPRNEGNHSEHERGAVVVEHAAQRRAEPNQREHRGLGGESSLGFEQMMGDHDPEGDGNHLRAFQVHVINNLARESGMRFSCGI